MSRVTRYDKIALFVNQSNLYSDLCPQGSKIRYLHLKPLLQNIVYPEAISEIQTLTDAYNAERTQEDELGEGLGSSSLAARGRGGPVSARGRGVAFAVRGHGEGFVSRGHGAVFTHGQEDGPTEGRTSCSLAGRGREEPLSARSHMGGFAGRGNGAASTGRFP